MEVRCVTSGSTEVVGPQTLFRSHPYQVANVKAKTEMTVPPVDSQPSVVDTNLLERQEEGKMKRNHVASNVAGCRLETLPA